MTEQQRNNLKRHLHSSRKQVGNAARRPVVRDVKKIDASQLLEHFTEQMRLRSRFAEDCLAQAIARDARQYVIVGAGLDTLSWRQPEFARNIRIFSVDHVTALAW